MEATGELGDYLHLVTSGWCVGPASDGDRAWFDAIRERAVSDGLLVETWLEQGRDLWDSLGGVVPWSVVQLARPDGSSFPDLHQLGNDRESQRQWLADVRAVLGETLARARCRIVDELEAAEGGTR